MMKIVRSKYVVGLIVALVIIYTLLIFVDIALNKLLDKDQVDSFD